ncbi:MAG: SHOCT domain-containing protein [Clostridiales bacterium]|nr:SHOCT domain-containing protein [Clostridiales bacterium]
MIRKRVIKGGGWMLAAAIISYTTMALNIIVAGLIAFDPWGIIDIVNQMYAETGYEMDTTFMLLELCLIALVNLSAGIRYMSIRRRGVNPRRSTSYMFQPVIQMCFGSLLAGLLALVGIVQMSKVSIEPIKYMERESSEDIEVFGGKYRKEAMVEAITRLKELRSKGAISEDEYYATLDKILES